MEGVAVKWKGSDTVVEVGGRDAESNGKYNTIDGQWRRRVLRKRTPARLV